MKPTNQNVGTQPLITIIIATRNCADDLRGCISSIRCQNYKKYKVIIADGGSTDQTLDIIKENIDLIYSWTSSPDKGVYDAWNRALDGVDEGWVLFMGADDRLYTPETLDIAVEALSELSENVLVAYGTVSYSRRDGSERIVGESWAKASTNIGTKMPIPHQAAFHRAQLFEGGRKFVTKFKIAADYEMILWSASTGEIAHMPGLVVMSQGLEGMSSLRSNRLRILREYREIQKAYGYTVTIPWIIAVLKGIFWSLLTAGSSKKNA